MKISGKIITKNLVKFYSLKNGKFYISYLKTGWTYLGLPWVHSKYDGWNRNTVIIDPYNPRKVNHYDNGIHPTGPFKRRGGINLAGIEEYRKHYYPKEE